MSYDKYLPVNVSDDDFLANSSSLIICCLFYSEGDPRLYTDYFTSFKSFVERSLDIHKVISVSYIFSKD